MWDTLTKFCAWDSDFPGRRKLCFESCCIKSNLTGMGKMKMAYDAIGYIEEDK